jgi:hypothetical protein
MAPTIADEIQTQTPWIINRLNLTKIRDEYFADFFGVSTSTFQSPEAYIRFTRDRGADYLIEVSFIDVDSERVFVSDFYDNIADTAPNPYKLVDLVSYFCKHYAHILQLLKSRIANEE